MKIRIIAIIIISSFTLYPMENNFHSRVTTDEEKTDTHTKTPIEQRYQLLCIQNKENTILSSIEIKKQTPTTTVPNATSTTTNANKKNERKKRFKEQCKKLKKQKAIADNRNLQSSFAIGEYKQILQERNLFSSILAQELEVLCTTKCSEQQTQKTLEKVAKFLT